MSKKEVKNKYKKLIKEAINDLKTPGKRHKQIPNILTALRLLAPLLIIPTALTGNIPLTIGLAAGFGITDFIDGLIARKFHLQSELGAKLDALSDKVFVGTLLISASAFNPLLLMNLALELAITGINVNEELKGNNPESSKIGKIKTWFLFALSSLGIVSPGLNINHLVTTLAIPTTILQSLTVGSYLKKYNKKEKSKKKLKVEVKKTSMKSVESTEPSLEKEKVKKDVQASDPTKEKASYPEREQEQIQELKILRESLLEEKNSKKENEQIKIKKYYK